MKFAVLVMLTKLNTKTNSGVPDIIIVDAEGPDHVAKAVQQHSFKQSWWQEGKSRCQTVKYLSLEECTEQGSIPKPLPVRSSKPPELSTSSGANSQTRRRRRKRGNEYKPEATTTESVKNREMRRIRKKLKE